MTCLLAGEADPADIGMTCDERDVSGRFASRWSRSNASRPVRDLQPRYCLPGKSFG